MSCEGKFDWEKFKAKTRHYDIKTHAVLEEIFWLRHTLKTEVLTPTEQYFQDQLGLTRMEVRTALKRLIKDDWILRRATNETTKKRTITTLLKYNEFLHSATNETTIETTHDVVVSLTSLQPYNSTSVSKGGVQGGKTQGSGQQPPSPADQQRSEKQTDWVKKVLFAGCEIYQSDPKLCDPGKTGTPLALVLYRSWKQAYPAVDLVATIRKAHAWEVANPLRRKKNHSRFLNNWLAKEQERGGVFRDGPVTSDTKRPPFPQRSHMVPPTPTESAGLMPVGALMETLMSGLVKHGVAA